MPRVRWIDASASGVKFALLAGAREGDLLLAVVQSPSDSGEPASRRSARDPGGILRNRLGFAPRGRLGALVRPLRGITVAQILAALPGSRETVVDREAVLYSAEVPPPPRPDVLPSPPIKLGINAAGETVSGERDGARFVTTGGGEKVFAPVEGGSRFLLVRDAGDFEGLYSCACALVAEMERGQPVDWHRLRRFASLIFGHGGPEKLSSEMPEDDARLRRFQEAFEAALAAAVASRSADGIPSRETFDQALALYERQPVFSSRTSNSVANQQYSTPLPMAVVAARLAAPDGARGKLVYEPAIGNGALVASLSGARVIGADIDANRARAVRELPQVAEAVVTDTVEGKGPEQASGADIVLANPPFGGIKPTVYRHGGAELRVQRQDFLMALRALEKRADDGVAVFILGADSAVDSRAGQITGGSRHFFNWLADHYQVHGVAEIDGALYARQGAAFPVRMVVVGHRGSGGPQVPDHIPVITDWEGLWSWADSVVKARATAEAAKQPDGPARELNQYQTPYVPASGSGQPRLMIPRNLALPTRACLADVEAQHGSVDRYVSASLEWTQEELAERLSPEQIDAVAIALHRYEAGQGFVIADQTGIGKGRMLATLTRYAILNGHRPVFLTEKANLFSDLYRDLADIGMGAEIRPFILNSEVKVFDAHDREMFRSAPVPDVRWALEHGAVPDQYNCVLATYSQFNRDFTKSAKAQWLAAVAGGQVLILDESHNAAGDSHTGVNAAKAIAAAAQTVYSSATFLKRAENLLIYWKLFPESAGSMEQLRETLRVGGEPLLEALSSMLARSGAMIRREHDLREALFTGEVETDSERAARNVRAADLLAEVLDAMMHFSGDVEMKVESRNKEIEREMRDLPEDVRKGSRMGASSMSFGSRLFQVSKQFYAALKAEQAAERAVRVLKEGGKPVVFTEGTGESLLRELLDEENTAYNILPERDDSGAPRVPLFKDLLHLMLERLRTVRESDRYGMVRKYDVTELCREKRESEALDSVLQKIHDLIETFPDLPVAPLDLIARRIKDAGYTCDEVSGRNVRLAFGKDGEVYLEAAQSTDRWTIINAFQRGDIDALVITGAGSGGISLHAAATVADQRPRTLIMMDPPGDINRMVQAMGRVFRYGQVAPPTISMLGSGVVGETRMQMMTNRKLRQLSANVTSDQESASLNRDIPDILNSVGNEVCARFLVNNPDIAQRLNIDTPDLDDASEDDDLRFVNRLTSRLLLLPTSLQEQIYDQLRDEYEVRIAELEAEGRNPLRSERVEWALPRIEKESVYQSGIEGDPFGAPVLLQQVSHEVETKPLRRAQVMEALAAERDRLARDPRLSAHGGNSLSGLAPIARQYRDQIVGRINAIGRSVEGVLNSTDENTFKATLERLDTLENFLSRMRPGARVTFDDPATHETVDGLVARIDLPPQFAERQFSRYGIGVLAPGDEKPRLFTFYKLPAMRDIRLAEPEEQYLARYDQAEPVKLRQQRQLLTGNLFQAALQAARMRTGTMVAWADAEGQVRRGVLLPKWVTPEHLAAQPVTLETAAIARTYIQRQIEEAKKSRDSYDYYNCRIATSLNASPDRDLLVYRDYYSDEWKLSVPGSKVRGGTFFLDEELRKLVGDFNGTRASMSAKLPAGKKLDQVISRLYQLGARFVAPPEARDWINEQRVKQAEKARPPKATEPATPGTQPDARMEETDEVSARL